MIRVEYRLSLIHIFGKGRAVVDAGDQFPFRGGVGKDHRAVADGPVNGEVGQLSGGEVGGGGHADEVPVHRFRRGGCGERKAVSYAHLDVYKRQPLFSTGYFAPTRAKLGSPDLADRQLPMALPASP